MCGKAGNGSVCDYKVCEAQLIYHAANTWQQADASIQTTFELSR